MPKQKIRGIEENPHKLRNEVKSVYLNKYFNLFMSAYEINGLDYQQSHFLLKKFWSIGHIGAFKITDLIEGDANTLVFADFVSSEWNIYDFPTKVTFVNPRGAKFIPTKEFEVDKDCVIGFAQPNQKSVFWVVNYYCQKIADIEMVIRCNMKSHKTPLMFVTSSENSNKIRAFNDKLNEDDNDLFVDVEDVESVKALISGANYNLDKLKALQKTYEDDLREFLGFNNLGVGEKKEHLIGDEVASNNQITQQSSNCFLDTMKTFFEQISSVLGVSASIDLKNKPFIEETEQEKDGEDYDE